MLDCFSVIGLVLNIEKTNIAKFTPSYCQNEPFQIMYQSKVIAGIDNIKFLGLELDIDINWKKHVYKILPKISSVCRLVRMMYPYGNTATRRMFYFAYLYAVMEYVS
jgi:hypothetical protein